MELRDYQRSASDACVEFFKSKSKKRPIIVSPTGSGKSLIIADVASKVGSVMVLQPQKELLEQNYSKYLSYGASASIYSASLGKKEIGDVTFATIGSVKDFAADFSHIKHVIVDECHLLPPSKAEKKPSMFVKFLEELDAKVIGLTATAFRLKRYRDIHTGEPYAQINLLTREVPKFFNDFLHVIQIGDLFQQGYLCPIKQLETSWDASKLKVNTSGSEYTDESMERAMRDQQTFNKIPGFVDQAFRKGRKHCLVFVKSIQFAILLGLQVPDSACVHSELKPEERERILTDFKSGKIKTVFNVGVLTTGFDFPALDTIVIARPTMSLSLFMQMVGRGTRIFPGKEYCAVLDMCGNFRRFGNPEDIRYEKDQDDKWVLTSKGRVLSGVRM